MVRHPVSIGTSASPSRRYVVAIETFEPQTIWPLTLNWLLAKRFLCLQAFYVLVSKCILFKIVLLLPWKLCASTAGPRLNSTRLRKQTTARIFCFPRVAEYCHVYKKLTVIFGGIFRTVFSGGIYSTEKWKMWHDIIEHILSAENVVTCSIRFELVCDLFQYVGYVLVSNLHFRVLPQS